MTGAQCGTPRDAPSSDSHGMSGLGLLNVLVPPRRTVTGSTLETRSGIRVGFSVL